ncbi:MAG: hypothetical protein R3E83_14990 [Burkholderiaceae bacterium]
MIFNKYLFKSSIKKRAWLGVLLVICGLGAPPLTHGASPDDAASSSRAAAIEAFEDFALTLPGGRVLPLRAYRPAPGQAPRGLILFSHGLGGSRAAAPLLGMQWASRGYGALFIQHPGSDESIWRGLPVAERAGALRDAATAEQLLRRVRDVHQVIDALRDPGSSLAARLGIALTETRIGMAGHSFGARTTQIVAGQWVPSLDTSLTDERIRAALVLSPSSPRGLDPARVFAGVKRPWLLVTGTQDEIAIGARLAQRMTVFPALAEGGKYELVLDGAHHGDLVGRGRPVRDDARDPAGYMRAIAALSVAFWDAWLNEDLAARRWLEGEGARSVLTPADRWRHK